MCLSAIDTLCQSHSQYSILQAKCMSTFQEKKTSSSTSPVDSPSQDNLPLIGSGKSLLGDQECEANYKKTEMAVDINDPTAVTEPEEYFKPSTEGKSSCSWQRAVTELDTNTVKTTTLYAVFLSSVCYRNVHRITNSSS